MIKAIETGYKGFRFRSRLEARWAIFFDVLDVPWEYEPEGFDLTQQAKEAVNAYTKAQGLDRQERLVESTDEFAKHMFHFWNRDEITWLINELSGGKKLFYLPDFYLPTLKRYIEIKPYIGAGSWGNPEHAPIKLLGGYLVHGVPGTWGEYEVCTFEDIEQYFGYCPICNTFGVGFLAWAERICSDPAKCPHGRKDRLDQTKPFQNAIIAARSARFEHGETPRV